MPTTHYNPPPNWPAPPAGWTPPPGWQPDQAWGPAPDGWQVWAEDGPRATNKRTLKFFGVIAAAVIVLVGIGSVAGGGVKGSTPASTPATSAPAATSTPATALPPMGTAARAKSELREKFGKRVVQLDDSGGVLTLGLKAPDSFAKTLIPGDANDAFRQVYKDAGYAPKEMLIQFHGPLVVKATGAEHDGVYAVYDITSKQAARIVWANQDEIDWTTYLTMQRADL